MSLENYSKLMRARPKVDYESYNVYSEWQLPDKAIDYALTDAMILKDSYRDRAGVPTEMITAPLGMCAYVIPPDQRALVELAKKTCPNFQCMTFEQLCEKIAFDTGFPVDIIDAGSGLDFDFYQREGKNCVPQALYHSIMNTIDIPLKTRKKMAGKDSTTRANILHCLPGVKIDLPKLMKEAKTNGGVGLHSIRPLFKADGSRTLHLWTTERPDGRFYPQASSSPGDIHIVISNFHAYAVVPRGSTIMKRAVDCPRQCWKDFPGSPAERLIQISQYKGLQKTKTPYLCPMTH